MSDKDSLQTGKVLESWKEIADCLGVSVRTAQKWEKERGLPVRRLPGTKGRVVADALELGRWREVILERPHWWANSKFLRYYALAATGVLLVTLGTILGNLIIANRKGVPASFRIEPRSLIVTDSGGGEVWRMVFPDPLFPRWYSADAVSTLRTVWFGDVDDDGDTETLFVYYPVTREKIGTSLICFSKDGKEKWRFVPGKPVRDGTGTYSRLYIVTNFAVARLEKNGPEKVLVTSHHVSNYPNQFAVLNGDGTVVNQYWHSGHLEHLDIGDVDGDGANEIFLAGVNNGHRAATLVVLDPRNVYGASFQGDGSPFQLQGFSRGREKAVVFFPRTCVNRRYEDQNVVRLLAVNGGRIKVNVAERQSAPACELIYVLNQNLDVVSVEFSQQLRNLHRELQSRGELDHSLSEDEVREMANLRIVRTP